MNMNLKKIISSVAALALSASCFTAFAASFTDVPDTNAAKTAIDTLVALKIVNGYEDGTFKPDNEITRAEVTKMVVAAMGPSYTSAAESAKATSDFTDLNGHWATGYINVGVAQSFINGMGDGTFAPDANVTYAQIVKMLVAALGYTTAAEANGGFPNGYLQVGSSIGVTANVSGVSADTNVTRAIVAQLIDNALDTPIVAVTGWTNDIYGKPVATTEVMDGTGDSKKYQTLLTENHDAYVVKGRVMETHAMAGTIDSDKVKFRVEYSDNYDGDKVEKSTSSNDNSITEDMYFGDTAAESALFTYAEAVVAKDDNDEFTIVSITPYGKNDIVELSADDFDSATYTSGSKTIDFTTAGTSKTKTYKLEDEVELYVNGVLCTYNSADIGTYLANNEIGTVTLIDTPSLTSTSKNGKYDYIMVNYYKWAVVDSVAVTSTQAKVYFKDSEDGMQTLTINLDDVADGDVSYTVTKADAEIKIEDLKENDILLLTYDPSVGKKVSDSSFINIIASDTIVEGKVSTLGKDDDKIIYTVGGTKYTCVKDAKDIDTKDAAMVIGNDYVLRVDAFNRVVDFDETVASSNYGVIDRVYTDNNTGDKKVRVIKGDGSRVAYTVKDTTVQTAASTIAYGSGSVLDGKDTSGASVALTGLDARVITYKVNSNSEIHTIKSLAVSPVTKQEFTASSLKVSSAKMSESTVVLDLSDLVSKTTAGKDYTTSDIKSASTSTFVDGEEYSVLYGDKANDGTYRFVIITEGSAAIAVKGGFAVVDSVSEGQADDGNTLTVLAMYVPETDELTELFVSDNMDSADKAIADACQRGSIVAYSLDSDGRIKNIAEVTNTYKKETADKAMSKLIDNNQTYISYANASKFIAQNKFSKTGSAFVPARNAGVFLDSAVPSWDNSETSAANGYARVAFGAIVDKTSSGIDLAVIEEKATGKYSSEEGSSIYTLDFDSNVNVYVYDYNEKSGNRLSKGTLGSVVKTTISKSLITSNSGNDYYDWNAIEGEGINANYAYVKTVDGDITDILVIIPKD